MRWAWLAALGLIAAGVALRPGAPRAEEASCTDALDSLAVRLEQAERREDAARAALAAEQARARALRAPKPGGQGSASELPNRIAQRLAPALEVAGAELLAAECEASPCVVAIGLPRIEGGALTPRLQRLRSALDIDDRHDQVVRMGGVVVLVAPVGPGATPGEDAARMARLLAEVAEEVR